MLTDEELIGQIRLRLHDELGEMYPADRVIHVWEEVENPAPLPASRRQRAHRRFPRMGTAAGVLAALAIVAVVVVAAFALLGGSSEPSSQSAASRSSEQALLRILGILRRPQTKADLPPELWRRLHLDSRRGRLGGTPDLAGVRLATVTPQGEEVFLVPMKPATTATVSAFVANLPAPARARVRANLERELRAQHGQDQLEIAVMYRPGVRPGLGGPGAQCCITAQDIEHGPAGFLGGSGESGAGPGSSQGHPHRSRRGVPGSPTSSP